jgi:hypothetical protein
MPRRPRGNGRRTDEAPSRGLRAVLTAEIDGAARSLRCEQPAHPGSRPRPRLPSPPEDRDIAVCSGTSVTRVIEWSGPIRTVADLVPDSTPAGRAALGPVPRFRRRRLPVRDPDPTRRRVLAEAAAERTLLVPAHFPGHGAAEVRARGDGYEITHRAGFRPSGTVRPHEPREGCVSVDHDVRIGDPEPGAFRGALGLTVTRPAAP